jgi:hypothetical protein
MKPPRRVRRQPQGHLPLSTVTLRLYQQRWVEQKSVLWCFLLALLTGVWGSSPRFVQREKYRFGA